ncbi:hypothetical protein BpHYR1_017104 [Brachionus plicatilis]|uniref:Uncharacterized protein n=1 Tax=Brachionus plicatilis TaxID=10195 RepID=A0A3M7RTP7_BRAPC|nr:hypothetical protein BpHYR1_017104 [Brachionus plicatilis]
MGKFFYHKRLTLLGFYKTLNYKHICFIQQNRSASTLQLSAFCPPLKTILINCAITLQNYKIFDRENTSFIKQLSKVEDLTHINCTEYDLAFSNIHFTKLNYSLFILSLSLAMLLSPRDWREMNTNFFRHLVH